MSYCFETACTACGFSSKMGFRLANSVELTGVRPCRGAASNPYGWIRSAENRIHAPGHGREAENAKPGLDMPERNCRIIVTLLETRPLVDFGDDAGSAAEGEPESRTGPRPGNLQVSEQYLTVVPKNQGLSARLNAVRQARRDVSGLPEPRCRRQNDVRFSIDRP